MHRQAVVRLGLTHLIDATNRLTTCASTGDAPNARQLFLDRHPEIVLLGLTLRGGDGVQLIKDLRELDGTVQTLVFSERDDALSIRRALRAGARGYLLADDDATEIVRALNEISVGQRYTSSSVLGRLIESFTAPNADQLTSDLSKLSDRELEIFSLLGRGFGGSALAKEIRVSVKTIDSYLVRMKEKLGVRSVSDLKQKAAQWLNKCAQNSLRAR